MKLKIFEGSHGLWLLLLVGLFSACQKEIHTDLELPNNPFDLQVHFKAVVDSLPLQFDHLYENAFNEAYKVTTFKVYICQIDLINTDSNLIYHVNKNDHYLIDAADAS